MHIQLLKNLFVVFLICFFLHRYVQNRSDIILFGATKNELSWSRRWCIRIVRSGKNCMRFCLESSYQVTNLAFKSFCFFRLPHSNVCFIANQDSDFSMSSNLNFRNLKFCIHDYSSFESMFFSVVTSWILNQKFHNLRS